MTDRLNKPTDKPINSTCPYSGKPASGKHIARYEGRSVAFCSEKHQAKFERTLKAVEDAIADPNSRNQITNETCPVSGKPVNAQALVKYKDGFVCFCSRKHAKEFLNAIKNIEKDFSAAPQPAQPTPPTSTSEAKPKNSSASPAEYDERTIDFTPNPIAFLDQLVSRHKAWLAKQPVEGEASAYMNEAVDRQERGKEFMKHYVHGTGDKDGNPRHNARNWALLELYEYWRDLHGMRPIEVWDGTRLRPWLPPESNPQVPAVLTGDLSHFRNATLRNWDTWEPIDALGIAIDGYFTDIRKHHVWSKPTILRGEIGETKLRLYRFNELNNIETAPYSIRFWGFLKFAQQLRCRLYDLPFECPTPNADDDITFMDEFNQDHFPWHDDVFENGRCPEWTNQHGQRKRHKYMMNTYGMGLEFLQSHGDLLEKYNAWLAKLNRPTTDTWRDGDDPWTPGVHHSAHILKQFPGAWDLSGTNGQQIDPMKQVPDLFDPDLIKFDTVSELGAYIEWSGYHSSGHLEHCDIRDVYTNNYSVRFFHWHQWLENFRQAIKWRGDHFPDTDPRKLESQLTPEFLAQFKRTPPGPAPFEGTWTYRSYHNEPTTNEDNRGSHWFTSTLTLEAAERDELGRLTFEGVLDNGSARYEMTGYLDHRNVHYELTHEWWDERNILIMTGRGTGRFEGDIYRYRFHLVPNWPDSKNQVPALVGSVLRDIDADNPKRNGKVGSFIAIRQDS